MNNNLKSWPLRHKLLCIVFIVAGINILNLMTGVVIPILTPLVRPAWVIIIFIGIPFCL